MIIAVIGEYGWPRYNQLVKLVQTMRPNDEIVDLSKHQSPNWTISLDKRSTDIKNSDIVVISRNYKDVYDGRRDFHLVLQIRKTYVFEDGMESDLERDLSKAVKELQEQKNFTQRRKAAKETQRN
jgi:hypothetical protein